MSPKTEKALIALLSAAVPLCLAATGWIKAQAQQTAKLNLADNYQEYIQDQMRQDERLEKALEHCMELLEDGGN